MKGKIIVFGAHPDDETFGCGGTIAKRLAEGYEVFVVVMTDGRNALSTMFGIKRSPTPKEMVQIRRTEMFRAMEILGVPSDHIHFLDFEDGKLVYNMEEAATEVLKILNEIRPVETYFHHEKDKNADHQAANRILRKCVETLAFSTHVYKYSLGQRFSRLGSLTTRLGDVVRNNSVFVDVSHFLDKKAAAIKEYKSQTTIINMRQNRPVVKNSKRFLKTHERFVPVNRNMQ